MDTPSCSPVILPFKLLLGRIRQVKARKRSKEYIVIILAVKESVERFSCLEFILEKKQTPGSGLKT